MRLNVPALVAVSGLCLLILGLVCSSYIFPKLEMYLIAKETALTEGSKAFKSWKKIPFPFKFKIYFFNVTNPEDVQAGSNPILKEIGPYVYDEFREKEILSVDEDNDTISYLQRKTYRFNQDDSICRSDEDIVTILNVGVVSIANKIKKKLPMALSLINDGLPYLQPGIKNVFTTNSVRNILFDGLTMSCEADEVDTICQALKSKLPPTIRVAENNRDFLISIFHHINGTKDGPYQIERGLKDGTKGKVISFENKTILTEWGGDYCNTIRGTDLTINPNLLFPPKRIDFFAADFCRSFSAAFAEETEYSGLHTYLFKSNNLFQSEEDCFCAHLAADNPELPLCTPKATMDISPCTKSPIVISHPHFLNAGKSLLEYARGLVPDENKHGTSIIMEPKTGLALVVKTRFQMNIQLQKIDEIDLLRNVSEGLFPFLWLEEGAEVPSNIIEEIRSNFEKLKIFTVIKYMLIIAGVIFLGASLILAMIKDKVFCFGKNYVASNVVAVTKVDQSATLSELYPQLRMKNLDLRDILRNNLSNHA